MYSISIGKQKYISCCSQITFITSPIFSCPPVWLWFSINGHYARVFFCIFINNISGFVIWRIINGYNFEIRVILSQQTFKTFCDIFFFIASGKNYANFRIFRNCILVNRLNRWRSFKRFYYISYKVNPCAENSKHNDRQYCIDYYNPHLKHNATKHA
jgi:hypothetical protein